MTPSTEMRIYLPWIPLFEDREILFIFSCTDVTITPYRYSRYAFGGSAVGYNPAGKTLREAL
jgi:hypothetical protein